MDYMDNQEYMEPLTANEAKPLLRKWREGNERRSKEVMRIFNRLWVNFKDFGNEKLVVLEQFFYAALDCHDYPQANFIIMMLFNEFPGSMRVFRYRACLHEAEQEYDKALEILNTIIKNDETNSAARKRRVAILIAIGMIPDAIKELVDYLKKFMSDVEGWQQLCELYLATQDYSRAVFCAEEMLLHHPHSHLYHQLLADIRYTMGGVENLELAKSYYCKALKLNPKNNRALLGLFLTTNNLMAGYKTGGTAAKRKELSKLNQWVQQAVSNRYRECEATGPLPTKKNTALDAMLMTLSIE